MTVSNPEPSRTRRVEPKVAWASIGSYVAGVLLFLFVNLYDTNGALFEDAIPDQYAPFILPLMPALVTLASGYLARHQWRVAPPRSSGSPPVG